jgi:serine/threonine-protein kinase
MSPCITPEQVRLLVAEQLSAAELQTLESHVEACDECQQTLARLLDDSHDVVRVDWRLLRRDGPAPSPESPSALLRRLKENRPIPAPPDPPGVPVSPSLACSVQLPVVPGYEILKELGCGGMGVVYLARHLSLNRLVALKMMKDTAAPREVARFRGEAEAIARLQHPHIVQIHEVGEHHGRPYLALEFVAGGSLENKLHGTPQPALPAARLVETLARAIHAAHQQGIIHRDLKPGNVLLAPGNTQELMPSARAPDGLPLSAFTPKITDFGLARQVGDTAGQTVSGVIEGTPSYIAPEQACSKGRDIGPAVDVYALGAILYELLTGRAPFKAATPLETLLQVRADDPVPPRLLQPKTPRDLETICLKCLQKEPGKRYASAQALADDLRRFQVGEPIQARPVGALERAVKWVQRKPAAAALWGVSVAAVALLLWLGLVRAERKAQTTRAVEQALAEATLLRTQAGAGPIWDLQAWSQALAAAKRAEALLEGSAGHERLRRQVRELLAELQAEEQDRRLVERLEGIRLQTGAGKGGKFDLTRADRDYAAAFHQYGIDVEGLAPEEAAARIRARPFREQLAAALDDWASVLRKTRTGEPAGWQRLVQIAKLADPDPWRNRFRDILTRRDGQALKALAAEDKISALPAPTWVLLGDALAKGVGDIPTAVKVLRQAQQQHPGDFWINHQLALYLVKRRPPQLDEALRFFTAALALRSQSTDVHINLGNALADKGELDRAIAAFREALRLNKDYAPAHYNLGMVLGQKGKLDEAIAAYREAIRLDKDFAPAHINLGNALFDKGDLGRAIDHYHKALALVPKDADVHTNLGTALQKKGLLDQATAAYHKALRLKPDYAPAHFNLGTVHYKKGKLDQALAAFQQAICYDKDYAEAHHNLGIVLQEKGKLDQAILAFQEALRLNKHFAPSHYNLGFALAQKGKLDQAIAAFREAIRLNPEDAPAHYQLGVALTKKGRLDQALAAHKEALRLKKDYLEAQMGLGIVLNRKGELDQAIAAYHEALRLKKDYAPAHYNLGVALGKKGLVDQAIAAYREALRLDQNLAPAHCNLGILLQRKGQFAEALAALKRGHELGSRNLQWTYPSARWVRQAKRLVELDLKLPAILSGELKLAGAERIEFARFCQQYKRLYAASARFYQEAFTAQPQLAENLKAGHRYNAACAAVLAGCGQGEDAAKLDAKERARLRQQALGWLRADLKLWATDLDSDKLDVRHRVGKVLQHWQRNPALAGVRDEKGLVQLPEAERAAWQQFWAEVETLLKKTQESTK